MDSFIYSINATVPIFGNDCRLGIKQLGVIDEHFVSKANKYVFHVALPVLLFQQISSADMTSQFDIRFVLYCMLATTAFFVITWVVTELLMKDDTQKEALCSVPAGAVQQFLVWHLFRICIPQPAWHR